MTTTTTGYTHPKGKGAGKYNGMRLAGDWVGKRVMATHQIRNGAGNGVSVGTLGTVEQLDRGLYVAFDVCTHCGTVTHVARLDYTSVELAED